MNGRALQYRGIQEKLKNALDKPAEEIVGIPAHVLHSDHKQAVQNAVDQLKQTGVLRHQQTVSFHSEGLIDNEERKRLVAAFMDRLRQDGGEKVISLRHTFLHIERQRFLEPIDRIKGLSLNEALLQLAWEQKPIGRRIAGVLKDSIVVAKESGFDLDKTHVAETVVYGDQAESVLAAQMRSKYLKGRGRYGSIPHFKVVVLEFILQQREKPFSIRANDPLEWLRIRLRKRFEPVTQTANEAYDELRHRRPIKAIYY